MELVKLTNGEREIEVPLHIAVKLEQQGWTRI
jgi:hypothetical protein